MDTKNHHKRDFYGIGTLGEKGQVVVPFLARKALRLKKGDKLLVFGIGEDTLTFSKLSNLEKIAAHLEHRLASIQEIIKKSGNK